MGKIVLLDDLTINQIAAGEVIERPASVVKELVENSIDAGAKNITVEIKNGGISYIRITDDGSGIMPDDMEIAFERHATSKIRKADDLDTVKSMGFRGEALASIAAIAKVDLVSRTEQNDIGYKIEIQGGNILDEHEEGCQKGTTITVRELFYNTPVRYKFLKKDFTESGYIEDTITRIALANPGVAIKLINTGKIAIQTTGSGKLEDVIYSIYGKEIAQNLLPVEYEYEDMKVSGVIGKPSIARSNRSNQLFFVNKRFIKDKTLTSAAEQAFKGLVTIGKHGFLVLNIEMDPKKVDVNVHPTKLEVRFQEEGKIFKAIYNSIKQALLKYDLVPGSEKDMKNATPNDILKDINSNLFTTKVEANVEKVNSKENNIPKYSEFKSTMSNLDSETRKRFIDELTGTKSPEEIGKKLADMTKALYDEKIKQESNSNTLNESEKKSAEIVNKEVENKGLGTENKQEDNSEKQNETLNENDAEYELENNVEIKDKQNEVAENVLLAKEDEKTQATKAGETQNIETNNLENQDNKIQAENKEDESRKTNNLENDSNENKEVKESSENITTENALKETKNLESSTKDNEESFEEMYKRLFGRDINEAKKEYAEKKEEEEKNSPLTQITGEEISMFEKEGIDNNPKYKFIGIAFKTYIILTMGDDLYILDQHAAHERIMYEKVKANYYSQGEKDCQLMLLPDIIKLSTREMGIFRDNKEMFNKAGFEVEEFGDNTVKLTGVPEFCLDFDTQEIFLETLDEINTVARTAKQEIEDKFLATVACKAAVKAHMALSKEEVDSLMEQLLRLPNPFTCPHGRPTVIKMSKNDIEKKFSRR